MRKQQRQVVWTYFRFKMKMYTRTYHKCQQHLSSSSAFETNREYLIKKKIRRRKKDKQYDVHDSKSSIESMTATEMQYDLEQRQRERERERVSERVQEYMNK